MRYEKLIAALKKVIAAPTTFAALDLTSFTSAKEWALENTDIDYYTDEDSNGGNLSDYQYAVNQQVDETIKSYVSMYNSTIKKTVIEIYRAVVLEKVSDLDLDNIGIHWSFEKSGAGAYGLNREKTNKDKKYLLIANINPKDIDWEYGFTSFLYYGEDQWECALNTDAKITITDIEGLTTAERKQIKLPLKGVASKKGKYSYGESFSNILNWSDDYSDEDVADAHDHVNLMRNRNFQAGYDELKFIETKENVDPKRLLRVVSFKNKTLGWLKSFPKKEWVKEFKKVYERDISTILKASNTDGISIPIVIGDELGDGYARVILAYSLGEKLPVAFFEGVSDKSKVHSDYNLNKLLPSHPLYHATPAAVSIVSHGEGICSDKGSRFGKGNNKSISLTRDFNWLLDGRFGNAILVLDRDQLKTKFKIEPVDAKGYMSNYEFRKHELEERVYTGLIPVKYIKAVILLTKPLKNKKGSSEYSDPVFWPQSIKYIYLNPKNKKIEVLN